MPRSVPLNKTAQQVTSSPLNQLFFDPTSTIKSGQSALQVPTDTQLIEELIQGWANFFAGTPGSLEQLVDQALEWLDSATGLDLLNLQSALNGLYASLQQSWINFQSLLNGISGTIDADVSDVVSAWNALSGDFAETSAAFATLLTSAWTAVEDDTGNLPLLISDLEAAWNTYIATVTTIETSERVTLQQLFNALLGVGTVTTGQVIGVTESIYPQKAGRGILIASVTSKNFRLPITVIGHGALTGPVGYIRELPVTGTSPDIFGKGTLSATARAYQYRLPGALTGRGALTPVVPELITISFIVGVKEFVYLDIFSHGSLTATVSVAKFTLTSHPIGQGVLTGRVQEYFSFESTNIDNIGMDFFGHGQLTATAVVKEFILGSTPSGRGALTAVIPGYVTTSFIVGVKEFVYTDIFGHSTLTATATVKQFALTGHPVGQGVLKGQVQEYFSASINIDSVGMDFFGRGQLTATATVKEFILSAVASGRGQLTALVPNYVSISFILGVKEYVYVNSSGRGTLTAAAVVKQFSLPGKAAGQGTLVGRIPEYISVAQIIGFIDNLYPDIFGNGALTAKIQIHKITAPATGKGVLTALVPEYVTASFVIGVKENAYIDVFSVGTLTATVQIHKITAPATGQGTLTALVPEFVTSSFVLGNVEALHVDIFGQGALTSTVPGVVTFDAVGAGATGTAHPSYTHIINGNAIIGFFNAAAPITTTMSVGGVPMTQVVNLPNYTGTESLYVFTLLNPPIGAQTITGSGSGISAVNTVSYNNVQSFGTPVTVAGPSPARQVVQSVVGQVIAQGFSDTGTITAYNKTQRVNYPLVGAVNWSLVIGDASAVGGTYETTSLAGAITGSGRLAASTKVSTTGRVSTRPSGSGVLSATAYPALVFTAGTGGGAWAGVAVPMNPLPVTSSVEVAQFQLTGQTSGHGALTAAVPTYVTSAFILGVKEFEYPDIFGHGTLTVTAATKKFSITAPLTGQGTLAGRVGNYVTYGSNIDNIGMDFYGHGQLTATAGAVQYDATGVGYQGTSTTPSFTHTINGNAVVAYYQTWIGSVTPPTVTFTVGGVAMSLVQSVTNYYTTAGFYASLFAFELLNPPTGVQTVQGTCSHGGFFALDSVSYSNVASFGAPLAASGV